MWLLCYAWLIMEEVFDAVFKKTITVEATFTFTCCIINF